MNRKIKILQFPIANSYGGITHYAIDNWKWMNKEIFQCDFATMDKKLDFADELEKMGSKIFYISCYAEENEEQFKHEINKILDNNYDVVHLHTKQWKSFLIEKICRERNVPKVIVHSHSTRCDNNDEGKRQKETLEHYRIREMIDKSIATDYWACSKEAAEWLFGDRIPKDRVRVMNNAIDTGKFAYKEDVRQRLQQQYNLENSFVIGNVGRLVYQKNQSFLIDVFAKVCEKMPQAKLMIIGDGELKQNLKEQVHRLQLDNNVLFMGKRPDVNELYQAMDLFVLPSNFEGLPITLVEAQTMGLRCFASEVIPKDVNITGMISFLPLDANIWAEKIIEESYRERKRESLEDTVIEKGYDMKTQIRLIEKMYGAGNRQ